MGLDKELRGGWANLCWGEEEGYISYSPQAWPTIWDTWNMFLHIKWKGGAHMGIPDEEEWVSRAGGMTDQDSQAGQTH